MAKDKLLMSQPLTPGELSRLADDLLKPSVLTEAALLLACLLLAWLIVRTLRNTLDQAAVPGQPHHAAPSVLFGRNVIDGVLFPLLALLLALGARKLLPVIGVPLAVFKLVLPVLLSLAAIRLTARVMRAAFPTSRWVRLIERTVSWLAWVGVVLWITGLLPIILEEMDDITWKLGANQVSLRNLIEGALSAVIVLIVALWVSAAIESRLLTGATTNISIRKMAANATRALLLFVGLLFALSAAGIDLTALGVLGGAVGVGIGFGLQKLASNYVSGFVILAERSLRIGDMVVVDGFEGRITDIKTRYTVIRALNGRESIVPNEMLITQRIENASLADSQVSVSTGVQVAYGTDLNSLMPRLVEAVKAVPRVLPDPGPAVQLKGFGADGLDLNVAFWIADPEGGQGNVRSDVNLAILACLNEQGVEIPFPQRVMRHIGVAAGTDVAVAASRGE
ncbi:mechanosensitive ion channel-like protein [Roseateles toxinivorans]|uniref:Mechanosensitive ion channel-like protein n=2 Tax=Roseateles toxinivorans TaxID=270368 RepID=A0A4V3CT70_9BURK|nr:mechanosensitive ion channel-like protein [Roseateles toxinivorans]